MERVLKPLTDEQIAFVLQRVAVWLDIKQQNKQMAYPADPSHSALLPRLLRGKKSLPKPPPVKNSQPQYPEQ